MSGELVKFDLTAIGRADTGSVMGKNSKSISDADNAKVTPMGQGKRRTRRKHDAFFRTVFSRIIQARFFVREQLPDEITKSLADTDPRILPDSFVGENLRKSQADLLMEVKMASGEKGFVYVLVEHKSYQDGGALYQIFSYMASIWQKYVQDGKSPAERTARAQALPPIIPILGYTGKNPWRGPINFADMIATDDPNLVFLRGSNIIIREWAQMSPEKLSRDPISRAALLSLTERGPAYLPEVAKAVQDNPVLQDKFAEYIYDTAKGSARDQLEEHLIAAAAKYKAGQKEGVMGKMIENFIAEGRVEGRVEGRAEGRAEGRVEGEARGLAKGRAEGEAKSLIRLLERRFGPLPAAVRSRIDGADLTQLDAWIDRVLDAKSLDAMFAAAK